MRNSGNFYVMCSHIQLCIRYFHLSQCPTFFPCSYMVFIMTLFKIATVTFHRADLSGPINPFPHCPLGCFCYEAFFCVSTQPSSIFQIAE